MRTLNLDLDVLRSFATGVALGSFARAADRLGRSPSAISLQLRKLEEQVGETLLRREGRGLALTEAGETMLGYARRLLDLNDEAVAVLRGSAVAGRVRLGLPQGFAETLLPPVLARFARAYPRVRIEARVDCNARLVEGVAKGELEAALVWDEPDGVPGAARVAALPMAWIGPRGFRREQGALPLVLFDPPCVFRSAGLAALDAARIPWRIAFTSPSLPGIWAAVEAGLGVTVRTSLGLPAPLVPLAPRRAGLPRLNRIGLALRFAGAGPEPAVQRLAEMLKETLGPALQSSARTSAFR